MGAVPHLKDLHEKFSPKGLVLLGIHTRAAAEKADATVREKGIPYLVALDAEGKDAKKTDSTIEAYAVDSYPDYYLVDRAGRLRFADLANGEIDRAIEYLLAEPAPAEKGPASKPASRPR